MKNVSKQVKIVTTLVLLVLTFLAAFNVTYSYFTAVAKITGDLDFANLGVRFAYSLNKNTTYVMEDNLLVVPVTTAGKFYSRGDSITMGIETSPSVVSEIDDIQIRHDPNITNQTDCYVRFWIDAYEVVSENVYGTTNYGKYFLFDSNMAGGYFTKEGGSKGNDSWCYFSIYPLTAGTDTADGTMVNQISLGNTIIIDADAPLEMLQKTLKITISFEAIQVANGAAFTESGFNDERGYLLSWEEND